MLKLMDKKIFTILRTESFFISTCMLNLNCSLFYFTDRFVLTMAELASVLDSCNELDERLGAGDQPVEDVIKNHLKIMEAKLKFTVPDFPKGMFNPFWT